MSACRYRILFLMLTLAASLAVSVAPASAAIVHPFLSQLTGFHDAYSVAMDDNSGDTLVADSGSDVVNVLNSSGSLVATWNGSATTNPPGTPAGSFGGGQVTVGANNTSGDVYVTDTSHEVVDILSSTGSYLGQLTGVTFANPRGIAVDQATGDIYVADRSKGMVDVFSSSGAFTGTLTGHSFTSAYSVAVDEQSGKVLVADSGTQQVNVFDAATGAYQTTWSGSAASNPPGTQAGSFGSGQVQVAADNASGHVYVADGSDGVVDELDASGNYLGRLTGTPSGAFSSGSSSTPLGVGVDQASGNVLVADTHNGSVDIFGPGVIVPDLTTGQASNVGQTSATLNAHVDPAGGGDVTSCQFEYVDQADYNPSAPDPYSSGNTAACSPTTPYSSVRDVTADLSSLQSDTTYHFRVEATNANGTSFGSDQTATTAGPPAIDAESSSNAVISSAVVEASINPFGLDTTCHVQYVNDKTFGVSGYEDALTAPCAHDLGSGFGDQATEATLTGLQIDTVYHFRFVVANAAAPSGIDGADETFATFGVKSFSLAVSNLNEETHSLETYTQAGGHPYEMTTSFSLNTTNIPGGRSSPTDANPKDVIAELPPGLIGNPEATPKCPPYNVAHADCSGAAQVGILKVITAGGSETEAPIYNLVPPEGVAAQFGARFNGFVTAHIDAEVRTGGDYGVTANSLYLSAAEGLTGATVTLWGAPADPRHDQERYCPVVEKINEEAPCHERGPLLPFLRNPTACAGAQPATVHIDSWQESGAYVTAKTELPAMMGCEHLDFKPTISTVPDEHSADSPSGLKVELTVPQNEDPTGLAEADLKDATVTLPRGVTVNPAGAAGLVGCSEAQIELHGRAPARCPDASKIGTVEIDTPLLDHPLLGGVYAAQQGNGGPALGANPFGSLLALYIAVDDPKTGVVVKLAGEVTADPATGQLSTTFQENPQLPFEHLKIHLFAGEHAVLATPVQCGSYTTETSLTPWSAPQSGPAAAPLSTFQIGSGPGGTPCASQGFVPSFTAGTTGDRAGGFSPFALTLTRNDGEQRFSTVATKMPPGLAGMVSAVPLCDEAQANAGTCPAASQIGHVVVQAGVGTEPITLPESGKPQDPVYLTGPYNGGPFGLSIVVPAEAGPFNLDEGGRPIVVRAAIYVDPKTAQVTVVSAPMPSILQGVPVDVKTVHVEVDRSGFIFNPTSCDPMAVGGTIASTQGTTANVSSRFQAAECSSLPFKPSFSVSTQAKHSKIDGAYLHVTVKSGSGQANIGSVKVDLPKQLPSRLSTLNLACTEAVFAANPAACPDGSRIGVATATTPVLPVALTGPAYFVSHGGARFPELIMVLQGYGVTLELAGETFISSKGITSSTFPAVPDVPVTRFDLVLPTGPHSVLGGNGNFCTAPMTMPTVLKGQNGAIVKQQTKVAVTGCKPAVTVVRKRVEGARATIVARVPGAGELTVSGEGLSQSTKRLAKAGAATVGVSLSRQERQFLARHPGRKLRVEVKLLFKPSHGGRLSTSVSLLMG